MPMRGNGFKGLWLLTPMKVMTLNANVRVMVALNAYEEKWL